MFLCFYVHLFVHIHCTVILRVEKMEEGEMQYESIGETKPNTAWQRWEKLSHCHGLSQTLCGGSRASLYASLWRASSLTSFTTFCCCCYFSSNLFLLYIERMCYCCIKPISKVLFRLLDYQFQICIIDVQNIHNMC